jgi:hypothetical protein
MRSVRTAFPALLAGADQDYFGSLATGCAVAVAGVCVGAGGSGGRWEVGETYETSYQSIMGVEYLIFAISVES